MQAEALIKRMGDSLLRSINSPDDLRKLDSGELHALASELREVIVRVVSRNGGHLASNLGVVELTLALHLEFASPFDKLVWDVGHQCYVHKLVTGRYRGFSSIRRKGGISGFPKRSESPHDVVETGHASTSISAALGLIEGQRVQGHRGKVVAVIGDGALAGGMALEGLNHAGHLGRDLIVVLNDNKMSISHNVGALSFYLSRLTTTALYQRMRKQIDRLVRRIPHFGPRLMDLLSRVKRGIKGLIYRETLFSDFGFEYVGPVDGHNLEVLRAVLREVRRLDRPVVVHVLTKKGKGYPHAEVNPTVFHGVSPFNVVDGSLEQKTNESFTDVFGRELAEVFAENPRVVAITAAMAKGTGLSQVQERFPARVYDVGITEQHAVTFAAGLAAAGLRPVVAVYSTFIQRAVDQVIHDVALPRLPVVFAMDRAGYVSDDGETHQGLYDLPLFRAIPNLTIIAPSCRSDLIDALRFAVNHDGPVMLRYPKADCPNLEWDGPVPPGRGYFVRKSGARFLLVVVGGLLEEALLASDYLARESMAADVYALRFVRPLDEDYLVGVLADYESVLVVEDGAKAGGGGESLSSLARERGLKIRLESAAASDGFLPHASRGELLVSAGLDAASIAERALNLAGLRVVNR